MRARGLPSGELKVVNASRMDSLIRLKFSERSAISAVPVTSTLVPYCPSLTRRLELAS